MLRCVAAAALMAALPAFSQVAVQARTFSAKALRGELVVLQPPQIMLNGKAAQLAPGARIRDQGNMLRLSGELVGQRLIVHYTRDPMGQPLEVWVLTPAEAAKKPWPMTDAQLQTWTFDPAQQQWTAR